MDRRATTSPQGLALDRQVEEALLRGRATLALRLPPCAGTPARQAHTHTHTHEPID